MYTKDGEKYFIVDSHMHYWDATPANWVPGAEQYAKGWIECFHAYQSLGPKETHWSIEKFEGYTEDDLMKDVFDDGHVDIAIFQPTYLKEWYTTGFNTTERNAALGEKHPGLFIANTRFDPRDGDNGLDELRRNVERYGSKGVKLYTAEWNNGSRGYKLSDPATYRFLETAQELGIKNVHVHKGPTIWPLDKDAFDVSDVDHAATDFPELNFIVEHVGLPRIEDFCFMATQEPNVYAGLSVVIGGLMHARPKFFAKVMGELLFWVGEDKMTFGSDYGIWEPKWQVEGFVDWQMPDDDELSDYAKLTTATKKKILGLNAAKLYDIQVPAEFLVPAQAGVPGAKDDAALVSRRMSGRPSRSAVWAALGTVRDPELDEPITTLGFVASCTVSPAGAGAGPAAAAHLLLRAQFRLPHGGRRLRRGHRGGGRALGRGHPRRPLRVGRDQRGRGRAGRVRRLVRRRGGRRAGRAPRHVPAQGGAGRHRPRLPPARRRGPHAGRAGGDDPGRRPRVPGADPPQAPSRRSGPPRRRRRPAPHRPRDRRPGRRGCHPPPPPPRGPHPYRHRGQHIHLLRHAPRPLPAGRDTRRFP